MSDTLPASVPESASPASGEPSASTAAESSTPSTRDDGLDTRAIAAQMFEAIPDGDTETAPPAVTPSTTPPTPAAATSDGADDDPTYHALLASGSMPVDRHKAVLTNARNKARSEVEQEFRAKYGWVDELKLDRSRADQATGLLRALDTNPEGTLRTLAQALGVTFAPSTPAAAPDGPPPPDIPLTDGTAVYSATQLDKLLAWKDQQVDAKLREIDARYRPLQERQVLAEMQGQAQTHAGGILAECRTSWAQFSALEPDIYARMKADDTLSFESAYIQAFNATGLPQLQAQWTADRASQLHRKAAASTPPPGAPRPVTPLRDRERSTADIAREVLTSAV